MENELFEIRLNNTGKVLLKRIHNWAIFFYTCTLLTCLLDLINAYVGLKSYSLAAGPSMPSIFRFRFLFNIGFLILYAILLPLQSYFFYVFTSRAKKAIQYENSEELNKSFKWLLRHAMLAGILFAFNSLWALTITITESRMTRIWNFIVGLHIL